MSARSYSALASASNPMESYMPASSNAALPSVAGHRAVNSRIAATPPSDRNERALVLRAGFGLESHGVVHARELERCPAVGGRAQGRQLTHCGHASFRSE